MGSFALGQNFFESEEIEPTHSSTEQSFFQAQANYDEPDQGTDSIGNPGDPVPVDNWIYLLSLAGIAVGFFYLRKKERFTVK